MHKKILWPTIIIVVIAIVAVGTIFYFNKQEQESNNNTNTAAKNTSVNENEPVEYNESYGTVCPLGVKFLGKKDANPIGCKCPDGYKFDSEIIGYEQCYGPGTECPIMSSECVAVENINNFE